VVINCSDRRNDGKTEMLPLRSINSIINITRNSSVDEIGERYRLNQAIVV